MVCGLARRSLSSLSARKGHSTLPWRPARFSSRHRPVLEKLARSGVTKSCAEVLFLHRDGVPRSMKMGNIASPWRYNASAQGALRYSHAIASDFVLPRIAGLPENRLLQLDVLTRSSGAGKSHQRNLRRRSPPSRAARGANLTKKPYAAGYGRLGALSDVIWQIRIAIP